MLQEYDEFKYRMTSFLKKDEEIESGLSNMLSSNELAGMPSKSGEVILESSVEQEDILTAAEEARCILTEKTEEQINTRLELICELFKENNEKSLDDLFEEVDKQATDKEQVITEDDVNQSANGS
jgi:F0F1-type ATP synthase membrane subunit b/b'